MKQPFASEIASGEKTIEFRTWATDYRGDLLITVSASEERDDRLEREARGDPIPPLGCALCVVDVVDVVIADGEAHWVLERPRAVPRLPTKGKQLLWRVDALLARKLALTW